jgi:hypothetical protein
MTAFSATLNVSNITVEKPSEDADHLVVKLEVGQLFPAGQNQAVVISIGSFNFPISGDKAVQFGEDLKREGEKMPKPSDLTIASNLDEIDPTVLNKLKADG